MSEVEILVARHGQTDWNHKRKWQGLSDIPLNETGLSQARNLGNLLIKEGIQTIHTSDLIRAMETARIVSEIIGVSKIRPDARLRERSLGKFEGWHTEDVANYAGIPEEKHHLLESDEKFADVLSSVEPWDSFRSRIWNAFLDIYSRTDTEKILIVGHGGVMRAISASITLNETEFTEFSNCQFMRISRDNGTWQIK